MLALAWPLILANLTQQLIQATDVLLMGRLGATQLAAATLGAQPTFTFNLLSARPGHRLLADDGDRARPALQRRARRPADLPRGPVADRHRDAALLAAAVARRRPDARSSASRRSSPSQGQTFLRAYMWCTAPWLLFQLLRNFVAALERPRIVLWLSSAASSLNALLSWALIFGHFGLPALGLVGGGIGSTLTWLIMCGALIAVICADRQFRRFHLFGHWWRFDGQRTLAMVRLGWPIGADHGARNGRVRARRLFHGLDRRACGRRARGRAADRRAHLHGPAGPGQAATVRVGLALGRSDEAGITRAGWTAWVIGVGFMGAMALVMWAFPRAARHLVPQRRARPMRVVIAPGGQLPQGRRGVPAGRRRAGHRRGHAARAPRHALAADLRLGRLLGRRPRHRRLARLRPRTGRASASGSGSPAGWRPSRC